MTSLYDFYKSLIRGCLDLYCNANDDENWKNNTNDDDLDEEDYHSCYVDSLPDEDLGASTIGVEVEVMISSSSFSPVAYASFSPVHPAAAGL